MVEWGPSKVTTAVVRRMEVDGLVLEVFTIGWCATVARQFVPVLGN